jgi:hypothetical protein
MEGNSMKKSVKVLIVMDSEDDAVHDKNIINA